MPYYCTVPRCTSMAGKAKNVSFHQFPRDEILAQRWNIILKRGKPYTKYSKVCSRHFLPEDYTVTNVNRQKGHWRTLRKDAIPSQNLPSDGPHPVSDIHGLGLADHRQQLAHAVYMQTMLAVHAASMQAARLRGGENAALEDASYTDNGDETPFITPTDLTLRSYKCEECLKCFMDPDVLKLHMRTHWRLNSMLIRGNEDERAWHEAPVDDREDGNDEECLESDDETAVSHSQDVNGVSWHKCVKSPEGNESPEHYSDYGKQYHESPKHHRNEGFDLNICNLLMRSVEKVESNKCQNGNNAELNESLVSDRESLTHPEETNGLETNLEDMDDKNVHCHNSLDSNDHESLVNSIDGEKSRHISVDETLTLQKRDFQKQLHVSHESSAHRNESKLDENGCKNGITFGDSQWDEALVDRTKGYESPVRCDDFLTTNGIKDLVVGNGDLTRWIDSHGGVVHHVACPESNGVG